MNTAGPAPLILTLALDADTQAYFDELRRLHFPPARNYLKAHLTLFHALPGEAEEAIRLHLQKLSAAQEPLPLEVTGVQFMGQGVLYKLESQALRRLHKTLQTTWQSEFGFLLSGQDRQPLQPHVTVQNKVSATQARTLHEELGSTFEPFAATGTGLRLWAYRGGPWEAKSELLFQHAN